jgi:DNA-binding XRE family transcriptional regulator
MLASADVLLIRTLRDARTQAGASQEDVAHRAGITVAAYARIERGAANPSWWTVRAIVHALGLTFCDIAPELDNNNPQENTNV